MEANELMIGDWVRIKLHQRNTQVTDIGSNYLSTKVEFPLFEYEIEPISLTAEILEKNGFEVQDQGGGRKDVWRGFGPDCEGDIEIEFNNGIPTHLKIDGCFKGEYYTSTNTKSVHELQHALRLCGLNNLAHNFKV